MTRWTKLNTFLGTLAAGDGRQLRDAIAAVYYELSVSPPQVLQEFRQFSEALLTADIEKRASATVSGKIAINLQEDERETMLDAARLLRALETISLEGAQYTESDLDEELERLWVTSDARHYVIPRMSALAPIEGKPLLRRALLHCRVIPTEIGSFRVRLHRSPALVGRAMAEAEQARFPRRFGAALFPGLKANLSKGKGDFTVQSLGGPDRKAALAEHLKLAEAQGCQTIVWGELTMPDDSIRFVSDHLAERALGGQSRFRYFVAGSWHRDIGGMRNAAPVLGPNGESLFDVFKWAKFEMDGRMEGIVPGNEVHVLICDDELVTVAVCRDFLDQTTDVPYRELNVDIAIVPSMIEGLDKLATLLGHAATADTMRVRYGTRTLVVAQPANPDKKGTGLVMGFPARPLGKPPTLVSGPWHSCDLESK